MKYIKASKMKNPYDIFSEIKRIQSCIIQWLCLGTLKRTRSEHLRLSKSEIPAFMVPYISSLKYK